MHLKARIFGIFCAENYEHHFKISLSYRRTPGWHFFWDAW